MPKGMTTSFIHFTLCLLRPSCPVLPCCPVLLPPCVLPPALCVLLPCLLCLPLPAGIIHPLRSFRAFEAAEDYQHAELENLFDAGGSTPLPKSVLLTTNSIPL